MKIETILLVVMRKLSWHFLLLAFLGLNESTAEVFQYYLSEVEDFEYACAQYGPPLYIFIYHYDQNRMLSLFPDTDPPYRSCSIR